MVLFWARTSLAWIKAGKPAITLLMVNRTEPTSTDIRYHYFKILMYIITREFSLIQKGFRMPNVKRVKELGMEEDI